MSAVKQGHRLEPWWVKIFSTTWMSLLSTPSPMSAGQITQKRLVGIGDDRPRWMRRTDYNRWRQIRINWTKLDAADHTKDIRLARCVRSHGPAGVTNLLTTFPRRPRQLEIFPWRRLRWAFFITATRLTITAEHAGRSIIWWPAASNRE